MVRLWIASGFHLAFQLRFPAYEVLSNAEVRTTNLSNHLAPHHSVETPNL
jgi:hypothetical protein